MTVRRLTVARLKAAIKKAKLSATVHGAWYTYAHTDKHMPLLCGCPMAVYAIAELGLDLTNHLDRAGDHIRREVFSHFGKSYVTLFTMAFDSTEKNPTLPARYNQTVANRQAWSDGVVARAERLAGKLKYVAPPPKKGKRCPQND